VKLQRNGFDFIFLTGFTGLTGFFRLRRGALSAEGRFIPMILLILSNFLLKMRIHSYFCRILIFAFLRFFFDQTDRFFGQRRRLYEPFDECGLRPIGACAYAPEGMWNPPGRPSARPFLEQKAHWHN